MLLFCIVLFLLNYMFNSNIYIYGVIEIELSFIYKIGWFKVIICFCVLIDIY